MNYNDYPKTELYVGTAESEKRRRAFGEAIGKDGVWLAGKKLAGEVKRGSNFIFSNVHPGTEIIVIDDVPVSALGLVLDWLIPANIVVKSKGGYAVQMVRPHTIMLVECDDYELKYPTWARRFDVVRFPTEKGAVPA